MDYWLISFRLFFAFALVLVFFQFSGSKRQFTQMTTFDLISNFILSAILGGYLFNPEATWIGFVYVLSVYFILSWIVNYLAGHTSWGRGMIIGTPAVIINEGRLNPEKLHKMNMSMTDFMSLLRTKEIRSLNEVKLAQIEVGGELTVVRKGEENYAVMLIENGRINRENLKRIKKTQKWLNDELKKQHIVKIEDVFYAQWLNGEFYLLTYK